VIARAALWAVAALLSLGGTIGGTAPCAAAAEQLVYWPLITDGKEYRRVPYPEEAGSLLVLADTDVVIEARRAPVSYWPITREYFADFSKHPPPVPGNVEIVDGSGAVTVAEPESFVVWHPLGIGAGPAELVHGEKAVAFYEGYLQAARAAAEEEREYQRILGAHQAAVEAWIRMAAERRGQNMPPPPPELDIEKPEPFHAFATAPRQAAVVSLPEGTYTMRIRDPDGQIVPGSERELGSFAPLGRAVGYVLRPEDRWTRPVISFAPDEAIYTTGRTDLFFQPVPVLEYDARRYARLFRPQSVEVVDPSLTAWTPREERAWVDDEVALALWDGDARFEALPRRPYRVRQLAGTSRGYEIEEFATEESPLEPDFYAMRVPQDAELRQIGLLAGGAASDPVDGSIRQVRVVALPGEALLFLAALLPLAIGLGLRIARLPWLRR
jgi:hypothetical protein